MPKEAAFASLRPDGRVRRPARRALRGRQHEVAARRGLLGEALLFGWALSSAILASSAAFSAAMRASSSAFLASASALASRRAARTPPRAPPPPSLSAAAAAWASFSRSAAAAASAAAFLAAGRRRAGLFRRLRRGFCGSSAGRGLLAEVHRVGRRCVRSH